jgi:hypothetical protein
VVAGPYRRAADLPQIIPVFPLERVLLLPHGQLPLRVFEPRYLNMVDDAMSGQRLIGMIHCMTGGDPERPPLAAVGCAGRITSFAETSDGMYLITLTGLCRFRVAAELPLRTPYRQVQAQFASFEDDLKPMADDDGFDRLRFLKALRAYLDHRSLGLDWEAAKSAPGEALVNSLSMLLPFDAVEQQALLEAPSFADRREALIALMVIDSAARTDEDEPPPLQ